MEQNVVGYGWEKNPQQIQKESLSIENFVHSRTRILNTKLEVLASAIHERLRVRVKNLERIDGNKIHTSEMLIELDRRANYLARQHKEKAPFYEHLFKLEQERRTQDVECWRDVVLVLRDFLEAWEAHEQAKAKAIFLDHV